jgi:hypothetical protein
MVSAQEVQLDGSALKMSEIIKKIVKDQHPHEQRSWVLHDLVRPRGTPWDNPARKILERKHI